MDQTEKSQVYELLRHAEQSDPITKSLQTFLHSIDTIPAKRPNRFRRFLRTLDRCYATFWAKRTSKTLVRVFFLFETLLFVAGVIAVISTNIDSALNVFSGAVSFSVKGQLVASVAAACFAFYGALLLPASRLRAYEQFRRATLVNLCLTEFFMFSRMQLGALPGLFFNIAVLAGLNYAIKLETREQQKESVHTNK